MLESRGKGWVSGGGGGLVFTLAGGTVIAYPRVGRTG
jgi:hypothetical protein